MKEEGRKQKRKLDEHKEGEKEMREGEQIKENKNGRTE